ncbi:MAG: hypothetical protein J6V01_06100, partial [Clostridia bacterium]|nr:hypothetical protein [Clostridia bacterium]
MDDNVKLKDGIDPSSADRGDVPRDVPELTDKMKRFRRLGGADESSSAGFDVTLGTEEAIRGDDALRRYYGYEKVRRRSPRRRRFTRFAFVFSLVSLLLIAIGAVVGWVAAGIWASSSADAFMDDLTASTDNDGWRRLLRLWLPESYPEYEDARRLAGEVLSPAFVTGKVTKLRKTGGGLVYMLFSDGEYFADIELERGKDGVSIKRIEFRTSYFDGRNGLRFPERRITVPKGAVLTVNSAEYSGGAAEKDAYYPFFSPAEPDVTANCVEYTFRDIYFEPVLSASLDCVRLEAVVSDDGYAVCFKYPESRLKTVTVTVPAGADAFLGGVPLTEDWAEKEIIFGELGPLDDNGTGTLPQLSRWTAGGLFGFPEASASIGGEPVALRSSDGGNCVVESPASCRYTVSVAAPAGADVTVNGVALTAA